MFGLQIIVVNKENNFKVTIKNVLQKIEIENITKDELKNISNPYFIFKKIIENKLSSIETSLNMLATLWVDKCIIIESSDRLKLINVTDDMIEFIQENIIKNYA